MDNRQQLTIGVILTLLLASGGAYYLSSDDKAYLCESKEIVMICSKLSTGLGTRCYYDQTYKICESGWKEYNLSEQPNLIEKSESITNKWLCNQTSCTPFNK
jgi:hypothetical protein